MLHMSLLNYGHERAEEAGFFPFLQVGGTIELE